MLRPLAEGDLIDDHYLLEALLGQGGFGEVWLATERRDGTPVALKSLLADVRHASTVARFEHEIMVLARLRHPSIVALIDEGHDLERAVRYFTMQRITGRPFGGARQLSTLLDQTIEVLEALAHAHARGVIHRDLKPGNVLVQDLPSPRAWLIDFGIMRRTQDLDMTLAPTPAEDGFIGTFPYMSPEQAQGVPMSVGPASDLYTVGVMLFEALSGKRPFDGAPIAVCMHHAVSPAPPLEPLPHFQVPGVEAVVQLVHWMLEKRYSARPEVAADVIAALRPIHERLQSSPTAISPGPPAPPSMALDATLDATPLDASSGEETIIDPLTQRGLVTGAPPTPDAPPHARHLAFLRDLDPIGRERELETLSQLFANVGGGPIHVLRGLPGSGRSTIVREATARAVESGTARLLRVELRGRSSLSEAVHAAIYRHLRNPRMERAELEAAVDDTFAWTDDALREATIAFLLQRPAHAPHDAPLVGCGPWGRLLDAVLDRLTQHPRPRSLIVWVDGGTETSSAETTAWLDASFGSAGRPSIQVVWSPATTTSPLPRDAVVIDVPRLADEHARRLAQTLVPELGPQGLAEAVRRAGGNPRMLRELLLEWLSNDQLLQEPADDAERTLLAAQLERWQAYCARKPLADGLVGAFEIMALLDPWIPHALLDDLLDPTGVGTAELQREGWIVGAAIGRGFAFSLVSEGLRDAILRQSPPSAERVRRAVRMRLDHVLHAILQSDQDEALRGLETVRTLLHTWADRVTPGTLRELCWLSAMVRYRQRDLEAVLRVADEMERVVEGLPDADAAELRGAAAVWRGAGMVLLGNAPSTTAPGPAPATWPPLLRATHAHFRGQEALRAWALTDARDALLEARAAALTPTWQPRSPLEHRLLTLTEADVVRDLGQVTALLGHHTEAMTMLQRARKAYVELRDPHGEAYTYVTLTRTVRRLVEARPHAGSWAMDEVRRHLGRAESLMAALNDRRGHALIEWEVASAFAAAGDHALAAERFLSARQLFATVDDAFSAALCLNSRGESLRQLRALPEALACYEAFLDAMERLHHDAGIGLALSNIAWTHLASGEHVPASAAFERAIAHLGDDGPPSERAAPHIGLALCAWRQADAKRCRAALREATELLGHHSLDDTDAQHAVVALASVEDATVLELAWALRLQIGGENGERG